MEGSTGVLIYLYTVESLKNENRTDCWHFRCQSRALQFERPNLIAQKRQSRKRACSRWRRMRVPKQSTECVRVRKQSIAREFEAGN